MGSATISPPHRGNMYCTAILILPLQGGHLPNRGESSGKPAKGYRKAAYSRNRRPSCQLLGLMPGKAVAQAGDGLNVDGVLRVLFYRLPEIGDRR